jgi:hypothetical protein
MHGHLSDSRDEIVVLSDEVRRPKPRMACIVGISV